MKTVFRSTINAVHRLPVVRCPYHCLLNFTPSVRQLAPPNLPTRGMKRKAVDPGPSAKSKRSREQLPDYCDVEPRRDDNGAIIWPAPEKSIDDAREFLREW